MYINPIGPPSFGEVSFIIFLTIFIIYALYAFLLFVFLRKKIVVRSFKFLIYVLFIIGGVIFQFLFFIDYGLLDTVVPLGGDIFHLIQFLGFLLFLPIYTFLISRRFFRLNKKEAIYICVVVGVFNFLLLLFGYVRIIEVLVNLFFPRPEIPPGRF